MADRLNIDSLRYQFDQGARPNRYTIDFFCPQLNLKLEGLRCVTASLPGRQLETADWSEYGPTRKLPYQIGMDGQEVSFTFVCDSTFADRFIIDAWQGSIFQGEIASAKAKTLEEHEKKVTEEIEALKKDPKTGKIDEKEADAIRKENPAPLLDGGGWSGDGVKGSSINPQFRYYKEYVGEIVIKQITRSDKDSLVYRIHEAYPISFAPMELSAENSDQLMRFECTFAFRTWECSYEKPNNVSGINKGRRFFDAIASIANLKKGGKRGNDSSLQRFNDRLAQLAGIIG